MIHDATVEVTCDGEHCNESVFVGLSAGARNTYLANDEDIERDLVQEHLWIVRDGRHYHDECCVPK